MSSTTHSGWRFWPERAESPAATGPRPKPRGAPVFIHDAITPWQGETMLLCLLREQAEHSDDV